MQIVKPEIRVERIIEGPRRAVFEAWTTVEGMRAWWGPGGFTTPYAEIDLRPGGSYLLVMQPPAGEPLHLRGTYREVIAPRLLVYTWQGAHGVPDRHEPVVTVTFEDLGDNTRVVVTHGGFADEPPTEPYQTGWEEGLEKLANHITTTRGDQSAAR
jgi:uncharacterized protein YndB with AHSA1/START domain